MKDTFCTSFNCRQRQSCKRALPIEDLQATRPYLHTQGYCLGFIPLSEECVVTESWFGKLFDWIHFSKF